MTSVIKCLVLTAGSIQEGFRNSAACYGFLCVDRWWKQILQRRIERCLKFEKKGCRHKDRLRQTSGILHFSTWVTWDGSRKQRNNKPWLEARRCAEIRLLCLHRRLWSALKSGLDESWDCPSDTVTWVKPTLMIRHTASQCESAKSSSRLSSSKPWIRCYLAWLRHMQQTWNRVWCTADKQGLSERLLWFRKRDPSEAEETGSYNIHKLCFFWDWWIQFVFFSLCWGFKV